MKWMEHEFEVDRDVAQGIGFEFWRKRNGATAKSLSANMFGSNPGGWLVATGTPNGLRALGNEAFVGLWELLSLERAIAAYQGKPVKLVERDGSSSYWYPVRVAVGSDYDSDSSYSPSDYAVSADNQIVAIRYNETVIFTKDDDVVQVHTFGGYSDDETENETVATQKADEFFHGLANSFSLEYKLDDEWGTAYETDPAEQAVIDAAVARLKEQTA